MMIDRINTQNKEFDAVERLSKCWRNIQQTAIVDDDYPEVRHYYENAVMQFLEACRNNGRTMINTSNKNENIELKQQYKGERPPQNELEHKHKEHSIETSTYTMSFKGLREATASRVKRWHSGGINEWSVSDWAVATMGEAGEMCNAIKKLRRIETGAININEPKRHLTERKQAIEFIANEMGDTLIYFDLLAQSLGIDLEECIVKVFNKKSEEYGFPERLIRLMPISPPDEFIT